jgi:outer membrane protein OmpA-like peptidoglycan-associated protein
LPGPEHIGWWAALAMVVSLLLHVALFFALDRMQIALKFEQARELSTANVNIRQVEVRPMDDLAPAVPEDVVQPPPDSAALLEEIELLAALPKDLEIDIKPDIEEAQYALKMKNPAPEGDPAAVAIDVSSGLEVASDLPELGREPEHLKPAEIGQVTVDPGAVQMNDDLGKFTEDLIKRGANGKADGLTSLDDLLDLPPNILLAKKTMLPSDLLFDFNKADLRESAKVGLMKLALLIDRNPNLYCWIEGHTDLVGGDAFNLELSIRRAGAVKTYLVDSLRMDASRISTRGFGRYQPIITTGTPEEQTANRRVEIRMRKTPPTLEQADIGPQKAAVIAPADPPPTVPKAIMSAPVVSKAIVTPPTISPKAVLVKPRRALPVEEELAPEPDPPRANPIPQELEAIPVEPAPPAAILRAEPVEE